jgi:hypothetical protein
VFDPGGVVLPGGGTVDEAACASRAARSVSERAMTRTSRGMGNLPIAEYSEAGRIAWLWVQ